ncbi:MAG: matrixin family metalloprotease [Bacteroidales bacterium]|jgi:hypothetical protein|nr:matrixin family metalloprotease [Bacteroidales bacterium]
MKRFLIPLLFAIIFDVYCYELLNKWLIPDSITINQTDTLYNHVFQGTRDSLANFNFSSCISDMNSNLVDSMPVLVAGGIDNSSDCIVRYAHIYDQFGSFRDDWYGIHSTGLTTQGEIDILAITLNDSAFAPWGHVSPSSTLVDINTTLRHEVGHALGLDHSQYSTSLMYEHTGTWTNPIEYIEEDEINGLRHVYSPPEFITVFTSDSIYTVNTKDTITVIFNDTLVIDLKTPEMLTYQSVTPLPLKIYSFVNEKVDTDTLKYDTISTNIYRVKLATDSLMRNYGGKYNHFRSFVKKNSMNNDWTNYILQKSPCTELYIEVTPRLTLTKTDPDKSDYYAIDSLHVFEATCTDANWNDYPYMESMKFYYKKDGETGYTEIPEPPVKTTYYTRTWDSKAYTGEVLIKATASYYSDATLTQLYETSDSITVNIFDGQTCVITNPKPAAEESWDFEFAPYIYSGYYSDHSLESEAVFKTTLTDVDRDFMFFDGTNWSAAYFEWYTCPQTKYHWGGYLGYEWQWAYYVTTGHTGEINGMDGWHNTYPFWDTLGPTKKDKPGICKNLFFDHKREPQPVVESEGNVSKFVSYYDKGYKAYYNDYEHLYPGIYNAAYHAYDINDGVTDIAKPASVDFLIPEWKLKLLNESKWFDYSYTSSTGPTYVERTEYHAGDRIHTMVWHPFEYYDKNTINFKITNSDTEATIFEKNLIETDYLTDTFITNYYAPVDTLAYYHHIWNTGSLEPGFYNIKAEGISIIDSINIVQEKEIQICPYFEQWENNGAWSADWPAPVVQDTLYWKIKDLNYNYYAANRYMLEAHYETGFHLNTTTTEDTYSVDNIYPAMLEICIAPRQKWNRDGNFWHWEEQLSNFTVELSKDGADYVKVKTLDLQQDGFIDYPWNLPDNPEQSNPYDTEDTQYYMICAMNFYFPTGEVYGSGKPLKIRLGIEGIPSYYTDEIEDNKISHIYIDEIKLWYMKGRENRPVPRNLAAVQAKESNTITLSFDPPAVTGSMYPEKYLIYRDGKIIAETTGTSFTDTEISGNTTYNYVVVADYPGYDFYQSSMLDCSIKYQTAPITYARPSYFTLSKGIGLLDNCVTLEWLEPAPGVSFYEIYRNSTLISTTTELSYQDNLLPDGVYEYYAKARYGDEPYEVSDATVIKSVNIYSTVLPIYEDYEHAGDLPLCWYNSVTPHNDDNLWASDLTSVNGITPYEGSYSSYVRGKSSYDCACDSRSGLRTPNIDLSSYSNLNLSYRVNLSHKKYDSDMTTSLNVSLYNNAEIDSSYCSVDHAYYTHPKQYGLSYTNITRQTNGVWQEVSIPVNFTFESCYLLFRATIYIPSDTTYIAPEDAAVMVDVVSLTGTIDLGTPTNVTIQRDSTDTTLSWDFVPGATEYKVYASEDPYGTFTLDTTGSWISDTVWQKADPGDKYFYYIVAASATKEIIDNNLRIKLKSVKFQH